MEGWSASCGEARCVKDFFCADVIPFFMLTFIILVAVCCYWITALLRWLRFLRTCCSCCCVCYGMMKLWEATRWLLPKSEGKMYC